MERGRLEHVQRWQRVRELAVTLPALGNLELHRQLGIVAEAHNWGLMLLNQELCDLRHVTASFRHHFRL